MGVTASPKNDDGKDVGPFTTTAAIKLMSMCKVPHSGVLGLAKIV